MTRWKQERPSWCGHPDECVFIRRGQNAMCVGKLKTPTSHGLNHGMEVNINTHCLCLNPEGNVEKNIEPGDHVFDLQIAEHDCDGIRWMLDAIDGKKTSWRSRL